MTKLQIRTSIVTPPNQDKDTQDDNFSLDALLEIISQQPITTTSCETICPDCNSTNIKTKSVSQTLVGGDPDPNHFWRKSYCRDCESNFIHEHQLDNHWYTRYEEGVGDKVLKGVSSCFESYVYTCNKCPGYVKQYFTELDGITPHISGIITYCLDGSDHIQREWFGCVVCDSKIETTPPPMKAASSKKLNPKWVVVEETDSAHMYAPYIPLIRKITPNKLLNKTIILVMGKSGCGKSTLEENLIEYSPKKFKKVISSTTRPKRPKEKHGQDYYFLSDEEYDTTDFIQTTEFADYRYGSSVTEYQTEHKCPILCITGSSARIFTDTLNNRYPDWNIFNIYFNISDERLMANMRKRGDTEEMIAKRIEQDTLDKQFEESGLSANLVVTDEDLDDKNFAITVDMGINLL
ncbi:hypothetical protein LCGC14_1196260 [marine sediment metagenome]|uniref:Guanylate kinase-like domain-containing protein n=1 Tax=marine sediment metagenome TaxID=412755 RepID=A0A0F9LIF6_9ZZZZ